MRCNIRRFVALAVVVGAFMALAAPAFASGNPTSLYRPFPEGLPANNAPAATALVLDRASWDPQYGTTIAQQVGRDSFVPTEYMAIGYKPSAPLGSTNSALNDKGKVVAVKDHNGSDKVTVLVVMNIVSHKTVSLMVRCGNPRLMNAVKVLPWKPFKATTVVNFNRHVVKHVDHTCPSGQKVSVTVDVRAKGKARGKSWGKVQGNLNLQLDVAINAQITVKAKVVCGPSPIAKLSGATSVTGLKSVTGPCPAPNANITFTGSSGSIVHTSPTFVGTGTTQNDAQKSLDSQLSSWKTSEQVVVDGLAAAAAQTDLTSKLNACPVIPVLTVVWPPHVHVGDGQFVYFEVVYTGAEALSFTTVGDSFARLTSVIPSDVRWDLSPCPQGTKCYRATLWGDAVGMANLSITVKAGSQSDTKTGKVTVADDNGGNF